MLPPWLPPSKSGKLPQCEKNILALKSWCCGDIPRRITRIVPRSTKRNGYCYCTCECIRPSPSPQYIINRERWWFALNYPYSCPRVMARGCHC